MRSIIAQTNPVDCETCTFRVDPAPLRDLIVPQAVRKKLFPRTFWRGLTPVAPHCTPLLAESGGVSECLHADPKRSSNGVRTLGRRSPTLPIKLIISTQQELLHLRGPPVGIPFGSQKSRFTEQLRELRIAWPVAHAQRQ